MLFCSLTGSILQKVLKMEKIVLPLGDSLIRADLIAVSPEAMGNLFKIISQGAYEGFRFKNEFFKKTPEMNLKVMPHLKDVLPCEPKKNDEFRQNTYKSPVAKSPAAYHSTHKKMVLPPPNVATYCVENKGVDFKPSIAPNIKTKSVRGI